MAFSKVSLLDKAVKITEAYAKGGGPISPEAVLRNVYEELKKLNGELEE